MLWRRWEPSPPWPILGSSRRDVNDVDELSGLARSQPVIAGAIAVFMFSLAGLPPLAGFWGKLSLFASAIELATSAARGTGLVVYDSGRRRRAQRGDCRGLLPARRCRDVFSAARAAGRCGGREARSVCSLLCAVLVVGVGAWPGRLLEMSARSEGSLRPETRRVDLPAAKNAGRLAHDTSEVGR